MAGICFRYYKKKVYPPTMSSAMGPMSIPVLRSISQPEAGGFSRIHTIEGVKHALVENSPVFIALPLYNNSPAFWKSNSSDSDQAHDFHAFSIEGYDTNGFFFRNPGGQTGGTMAVATCHSLTGIEL